MSSNAILALGAIGVLISLGLMMSSDTEKDQMGRYLFIASIVLMGAVKLME